MAPQNDLNLFEEKAAAVQVVISEIMDLLRPSIMPLILPQNKGENPWRPSAGMDKIRQPWEMPAAAPE
jgi:hypothetical protein